MIKYREDIDGLRAIAVLLVIIYHYFERDNFNGYIGVDIFFVISGFLITKIISAELLNDKFSITHFYVRRIRRIFPALFFMLLISSVFAFVLFYSVELTRYAKSLVSVGLFSSNFFFWSEAGYFDTVANLKPLLHTWSLAIEEQFYIVYPLILLATYKFFSRNIALVVSALCVASFLLNLGLIITDKYSINYVSVFYLLPTRAWELLVGGIIALTNTSKVQHGQKTLSVASWFALALILASLFLPFDTEQYPGFLALFPVIGAAILIYIGQFQYQNIVRLVLESKVFVFIGKISYSFYLWHWPIFVFANYYYIDQINMIGLLGLLILSFIFATFSWFYIEQPIRNKKFLSRSRDLYRFGLFCVVLTGVMGATLYYSTQMNKEPSPYKRIDIEGLEGKKSIIYGHDHDPDNAKIILMGDSHAQAFRPALVEDALQNKYTVLNLASNTSLLSQDICPKHMPEKYCRNITDQQLNYIKQHDKVETVVLALRWTLWSARIQNKAINQKSGFAVEYEAVSSLVKALEQAGKKVVIITMVPRLNTDYTNQDIRSLFYRMKQMTDNFDLRPKVLEYQDEVKDMHHVLQRIQKNTNVRLFWPHKYFCGEVYCKFRDGDIFLYNDEDHLSHEGAKYLAPHLIEFISD